MDNQLQLDLLDSFLLEIQERVFNNGDTTKEQQIKNFRIALAKEREKETALFQQREIDELKQEKEFLMQTVNALNKLIFKI